MILKNRFALPPLSGVGARAPLRDPISVGANVQKELLQFAVRPDYPPDSEGAGRILLAVVINEEGAVYSIRFLRCPPSLRASVKAAVCQWRYKPNCLYMHEAVPILTIVVLPYNFYRI